MMNRVIRDMLIAKSCGIIANANVAHKFPVGTKFTFDVLADPRAKDARIIVERILDKVSGINFSKLVQFAPYEVVYVAPGCPSDLICKDGDGDHFYMPSGVLQVIRKAEAGEFPPAFPEVEDEEEEPNSPDEVVRELMEALLKAA